MKTDKVSGFLALVLSLGFAVSPSSSQALSESAPTPAPVGNASAIPFNWVMGPARADLGDNAEIAIPEGCRFAGAADAAILLRIGNNPVPGNLAGVIAPNSPDQHWFVILELNTGGYVSDKDATLNPETILKQIRRKVERQNQQASLTGGSSIATVRWQTPPRYDAEKNIVSWTLRADTGPQKVVNQVVRLLGRRGFIDAVAVQPAGGEDEIVPLMELMSGVSYKPGEAYADFQKGDKVSRLAFQELIASSGADDENQRSNTALLFAALGVTLGGGVTGIVFFRRSRARRAAAANPLRTGNGMPPVIAPNGNGNGHAHAHANGNGNGHLTRAQMEARRRKFFNYQQYYSDLILQVSDRACDIEPVRPRRLVQTPAPAPQSHSTPAEMNAHIQIIAEQKALIEEQLRLIREQTRLIEEKSRLIQEKNKVLEKQSELFGNQIF